MADRRRVYVKASAKPRCPRCGRKAGVRRVRDHRGRALRTRPRVYSCTCPLLGVFTAD